MRSTLLFVAILAFTPALHADPRPPAIERDANGERIWDFTGYIKGTRSQIRAQITSESTRLLAKIKELTAAVDDDTATIRGDTAPLVAESRKQPEYLTALNEVARLKAALDKAHDAHDSAAAIEASTKYNHARSEVARLDRAALARAESGKTVQEEKARLAADTANLRRMRESYAKAAKWRDELVNAARNTFSLDWPLERGEQGTLGEVVVLDVPGDGDLWVAYGAREVTAVKQSGEGLVSTDAVIHPVRMLVRGANMKVAKGQTIRFDRTVEVTRLEFNRATGLVCVARAVHSEIDDLLESLTIPADDVPAAPTGDAGHGTAAAPGKKNGR